MDSPLLGPLGLIGDGLAGRSSRCALPTTAFLETPNRRPISALECPSSHSVRRDATVASVQSIELSFESNQKGAAYQRRRSN